MVSNTWSSPVVSLTTKRTSFLIIGESGNFVYWALLNLETDSLKLRNVNPRWVDLAVSILEMDVESCTSAP